MWRWCLVLSGLLACVACAPVISRDVRAQIDPQIAYADLVRRPTAYIGKVVQVAGTIISATNFPQSTRLEVLQYPADRRGQPQTAAPSGGRFLVSAPGYLETAVYRPGRTITVAGEVTGQQEAALGETIYRYPVVVPREMYLWPEGVSGPPISIGFGFGFGGRF